MKPRRHTFAEKQMRTSCAKIYIHKHYDMGKYLESNMCAWQVRDGKSIAKHRSDISRTLLQGQILYEYIGCVCSACWRFTFCDLAPVQAHCLPMIMTYIVIPKYKNGFSSTLLKMSREAQNWTIAHKAIFCISNKLIPDMGNPWHQFNNVTWDCFKCYTLTCWKSDV